MNADLARCHSTKALLAFSLTYRRKKPLSIRELSRRMKYSSDRALGMVLNGQRLASADMLDRLAGFLSLTSDEQRYVTLIAKREKFLQQNKLDHLKAVDDELAVFRKKPARYQKIESQLLKQIGAWFHFPLIRLLRHAKRPVSKAEILTAFENRVDPKTLDDALKSLEALGFVKGAGKAFFKTAGESAFLTTAFDVPSAAVRKAHQNQLARAQAAIDEQSLLDREFISKTLVIPEARIEEFKMKVRESLEKLSDELLVHTEEEGRSVIYQLSLQFYRQAKILEA